MVDAPLLGRPGSGATQASLRAHNLALVAHQIVGSRRPVSRADIAAATGMTRSTVSRLVDDLVSARIISEQSPSGDGQRGRPGVPLVAASGTLVCLGLEVNVRHLAACLVDLAGNRLAEQVAAGDHARRPPAEVLGRLAELGQACLAGTPPGARCIGVQLAVPGLVDASGQRLLRAPNLGWLDVTPGPVLRSAGLVAVDLGFGLSNEADCAARTVLEQAPGRAGEVDSFLYLSGEVGIGSAAVAGGAVMTGRHGWAGEIGHVCVDPDGPRCACGAVGCLETYAGRDALLTRAGQSDLAGLQGAVAAGDQRAVDAVRQAARALGIAIAGALNLLDLGHVVLGGHLAELSSQLIPTVRAELDTRVLSAPFATPTVSVARPDAVAAAVGAAYAGLDRVVAEPASWAGD